MCSWEVDLSHGDMTEGQRRSRRPCFGKLNPFLYVGFFRGRSFHCHTASVRDRNVHTKQLTLSRCPPFASAAAVGPLC